MKRRLKSLPLAVMALACTLAMPVFSAHAQGQSFPDVSAKNLRGEERNLRELVTGERTLVVAINDRDASSEMRAWFNQADERAPERTQRVSIIALDLPFFVPEGLARSQARPQVPEQYWEESFLGIRGDLRNVLGLSGNGPWAFVVDEQGRVVERVQGPVSTPEAERIWDALAESRR